MTDKRERLVHASYRRQVSDGNYGTESAEVYLEWLTDDAVVPDEDIAVELLERCHDVVNARLALSRSAAVRRAVEPRTTAPPPRTAMSVPPEPIDEGDELESLPF